MTTRSSSGVLVKLSPLSFQVDSLLTRVPNLKILPEWWKSNEIFFTFFWEIATYWSGSQSRKVHFFKVRMSLKWEPSHQNNVKTQFPHAYPPTRLSAKRNFIAFMSWPLSDSLNLQILQNIHHYNMTKDYICACGLMQLLT